jgi:hypothetical protein
MEERAILKIEGAIKQPYGYEAGGMGRAIGVGWFKSFQTEEQTLLA